MTETAGSSASGSVPVSRIITDGTHDLVAVHDSGGIIESISGNVASILGYPADAVVGREAATFLDARDRARIATLFGGVLRHGRSSGSALRAYRSDGEMIWLGTTARPVRGPDGRIVRVQTVSRDITRRKRTEEALRALGRHNRLILESVAEGIFGVDLGGRVTFINPACGHLLGYAAADLIGRPWCDTFHHSDAEGRPMDPPGGAIGVTLQRAEVLRTDEEVFWTRAGRVIPVEYTSTPFRENGRVVGVVVTFRDIRARLAAEEALRRAEWLAGIGETALGLRHEINNPLTAMLSDATMLELGGNTPEEEREMVRSIVRQARRIQEVLRRLSMRKDAPAVRYIAGERILDLSDQALVERPPG